MGKCKDCYHFNPYAFTTDYGECKYNPPQITRGLLGREYPICSAEIDGCCTGFGSKTGRTLSIDQQRLEV